MTNTVRVCPRDMPVDPVEGGSANDYDYVGGDPVNGLDLDGRCGFGNPFKKCGKGHKGGTNIFSAAAQGIYRHIGINARFCAAVCGGLTFQHGHLYYEWGGGPLIGGGINPTYHSRAVDKAYDENKPCRDKTTLTYQAFYVGVEHSSTKDWSISGPGYKGVVGFGFLCGGRVG